MTTKEKAMNNHLYKSSASTQKIEVPTNQYEKERLMKYHGVSTDYDLKLAIYRELLKKNRNSKS